MSGQVVQVLEEFGRLEKLMVGGEGRSSSTRELGSNAATNLNESQPRDTNERAKVPGRTESLYSDFKVRAEI